VDDQWALAMLVLASEEGLISLEGIVTTHAPNLKPPASTASLAVCREVIGVLRPAAPPPVVAGSSEPLREVGRPQPGLGPDFIVELSRGFNPDSRLTVLAIGAATDVASALLIDPLVAGRIEVVAMAFEGWPGGGDHWNVKNDPLAYRVILASGVPLTIGPADVCLRRLTVDAAEAARKTRGGGTAGKYLESKLLDWLGNQEDLCRKTTGRQAWPIWDLITVAQLLGLTRVEEYPRPGLRDDLTFEPAGAPGKVRWITDVDGQKLWSRFERLLENWNTRPHP
jgi:inosine-uridine nucleoside N-ribohydrolase